MTIRQRILKLLYPAFRLFNRVFKKKAGIFSSDVPAKTSFYDLSATLNNGTQFDFSGFRNKKVLIVNTASDCGFTAQFEDLEHLYQLKKDTLEIVAFPANDFQQERHDDNSIDKFCRKNYGITFPIMRKSRVGIHSTQNKVYEWLTDKNRNGWNENVPTWNFCKYLVDENGNLTDFFESAESPMGKNIISALERKSDVHKN